MDALAESRLTWSKPLWHGRYRIFVSATNPFVGFTFCHDDFDGADDANDNRHGFEATIEACKAAIDEIEEVA